MMGPTDYELAEPVGASIERFNWWAALFTWIWAASHGMWAWVAGLLAFYLGAALLTTVFVVSVDLRSLEAPLRLAINLAVAAWFGRCANRLLWNHDREQFYAIHRRRELKPMSLRERVVVGLIFAPFALLFTGLMLGDVLGYF